MRISTPGIVLRDFKLEQDRILTILTRDHGVLTAYAGKANRPRSALAGSTELFCYSDFVLFHSRGRYSVNNADSIHVFFGIRERYEDLALASYFCQLFSHVAPQEEPAPDHMQLLLGCLHYLETQGRPPVQLKAIAELRVLTLSGYMPNLVGCRQCNDYQGDKMYFTPTGQLVCDKCKGKGGSESLTFLPPGVLQAMRHIVFSDPQKIFNFTLSSQGFNTLGRVCENYLLYQLERTLPTLEFYRNLVSPENSTPKE